ncbi:MAG: hypothetical protein CL536_04370 [Alcaligenaceae bacterium]|nr:hypothetical protein [Alcaligenaceae bacterium]|tara:strand:+ start:102 stop:413 length:312 start_codon:yes stop_codon:yes gene_type:complete
MARSSSVLKLAPEQHAIVDNVIRYHRYAGLDLMVADLVEQGIKITRSSLHRYIVKLQAADQLFLGNTDDTVVVVMSRSNGSIRTIKTSATLDAVCAHISSLTA